MTHYHDTGERYSNDNHPEFPYGMKFKIETTVYSIYRTDDIANRVTVISKTGGHQYMKFGVLRKLFESGEATRLKDEE